jgi:hypothetical protein
MADVVVGRCFPSFRVFVVSMDGDDRFIVSGGRSMSMAEQRETRVPERWGKRSGQLPLEWALTGLHDG